MREDSCYRQKGERTRDWPQTKSIRYDDARGAGSDSRREVSSMVTMRVRRIQGNDCKQESTEGGHSTARR